MVAPIIDIEEACKRGLLKGASCVVGVFDGFHIGHRHIIRKAIDAACGEVSAVLTFDIDPDEVFRAGKLRKLMTNSERLKALTKSGVDYVIVMHFTKEFAALEPDEFLDKVFLPGVPANIFVGSNFHFGKGAKGGASDIQKWGAQHGMQVFAIDLLQEGGQTVSATRIRNLLDEGHTREAERLTGHSL